MLHGTGAEVLFSGSAESFFADASQVFLFVPPHMIIYNRQRNHLMGVKDRNYVLVCKTYLGMLPEHMINTKYIRFCFRLLLRIWANGC